MAMTARARPPRFPGSHLDHCGVTSQTGLAHAFTQENMAYQIGFGLGNLGLVYGQTSKKGTWEARTYWQHVEQYAVDVNLIDSDFFEGRANLKASLPPSLIASPIPSSARFAMVTPTASMNILASEP